MFWHYGMYREQNKESELTFMKSLPYVGTIPGFGFFFKWYFINYQSNPLCNRNSNILKIKKLRLRKITSLIQGY